MFEMDIVRNTMKIAESLQEISQTLTKLLDAMEDQNHELSKLRQQNEQKK